MVPCCQFGESSRDVILLVGLRRLAKMPILILGEQLRWFFMKIKANRYLMESRDIVGSAVWEAFRLQGIRMNQSVALSCARWIDLSLRRSEN